ncbi:MAG: zinc ribbon domain-containing protein [Promethearchaeota archaeon]|nr:MAG: zinc ribbon domain-containing protein [Candidatus Lokiarchaeota archaeon]
MTIKDYIWVFPLIGGFLIILAVLTPAVYYRLGPIYSYIWLWGLKVTSSGSSWVSGFNYIDLVVYVVCTILILIAGIKLIETSNKVRLGRMDLKDVDLLWLELSILAIVAIIIWIVILSIATTSTQTRTTLTTTTTTTTNIWSYHQVGFGVIGVFMGAIITLIGFGLTRYEPTPKKTPTPARIMPQQTTLQPVPSPSASTCPSCGAGLRPIDQFCPKCGRQIY